MKFQIKFFFIFTTIIFLALTKTLLETKMKQNESNFHTNSSNELHFVSKLYPTNKRLLASKFISLCNLIKRFQFCYEHAIT